MVMELRVVNVKIVILKIVKTVPWTIQTVQNVMETLK